MLHGCCMKLAQLGTGQGPSSPPIFILSFLHAWRRVGWLLDPEGLEDAELDESGPAAGPRHADLPLSVLAGDERARPTWLAAERHDATALVEDLCAAPAVWEPVEGLLRGVFDSDSDEEGGAGGQRDRGEFRPPLLADEVVRAVRAQLLRARRLPIHGTRVAFIEVSCGAGWFSGIGF